MDDVVKKYEAKELTAARAGAQLGLGLEDFKVNILSLCKGHWQKPAGNLTSLSFMSIQCMCNVYMQARGGDKLETIIVLRKISIF